MPELPEVETVRTILERNIINKTIEDVVIKYDKIIQNVSIDEFVTNLKGQTFIEDVKLSGIYSPCISIVNVSRKHSI